MEEVSTVSAIPKKRKLKPTILDSLSNLISSDDTQRLNSGLQVLQHFLGKVQENNGTSVEVDQILKRLIRGTGAPRLCSRKGHFSVLVAALTICNSSIEISRIFEIVDQELGKTGNVSKGEGGDMYTGQILVYGALIHSGMLLKCSLEEQQEVIQRILKVSSQRSYLPFIAYSFLIDLTKQVDVNSFKSMVWPIVINNVSISLEEQTLDTLHFLLVARERFPEVVNKRFFKRSFGLPDIIHKSSVSSLARVVLISPNTFTFPVVHPLFDNLVRQLLASSVFVPFWREGIEPNIVGATTSKECVALKIFSVCLQHIVNKNEIYQMLTPNFMAIMMKYLKMNEKCKNELAIETHKLWNTLIKLFERLDIVDDKSVLDIINLLLFYPGDLMFEKITGTRTIQILSSKLSADGIKSLSETYKDIILSESEKICGPNGETTAWLNTERVYAGDLLIRLISSPSVQDEVDWRIENLKFLVQSSIFQNKKIGHQLADSLQNAFFRALDQKPRSHISKLKTVLTVLDSVVLYIDSLLPSKHSHMSLRKQWTPEVLSTWKKMIDNTKYLNSSKSCSLSTHQVFHIMFLHMGLQLIVEPQMALEALEELHACYTKWVTLKKTGELNKKKTVIKEMPENEESEIEIQWIDVTVDLLLSMLSRNAHVLRNVVSWVFPHLCPVLTPLSLNSILTVLDPESPELPLTQSSENDDDASSGDDESDDSGSASEEEIDNESNDNDSDIEEDDAPVNLELQMALRQALGTSGTTTDTESVDLDDMTEEEGKQLDIALSDAFKMYKPSRQNRKKQSKKDRTLTHFRIRVLDLLEIYISAEPSLASLLEIIPVLFRLLRFCIVDVHQKPLEVRVRACLDKLALLRKFQNDEVTVGQLTECISSLLDKGEISASVYSQMVQNITRCCVFILLASEKLMPSTIKKKQKHKSSEDPVIAVIKNYFTDYFHQKCSHLPATVFGTIIQQLWHGSWILASLCIKYAFDDNIKLFQRCRALYMLKMFIEKQNRLTKERTENDEANLLELKKNIADNTVSILLTAGDSSASADNLKQKFVLELVEVLLLMRKSNKQQKKSDDIDWQAIGEALQIYKFKTPVNPKTKNIINRLVSQLNIRKLSNNIKLEKAIPDIKVNNSVDDGTEPDTSGEAEQEQHGQNSKAKRRKTVDLKHEKKQAKLLRMAAMSKGLDSLSFSNVPLNSADQVEEPEIEYDDDDMLQSSSVTKSGHNKRKRKK